MSGKLRSLLRKGLTISSDVFPEDSGYFNNTQAALSMIDQIIDATGLGFSGKKFKSGIITIMDEALDRLNEHGDFVFVAGDLQGIRDHLAETPIL